MEACADRYGDPFTVRLFGMPPMVFFTEPSAIKQIFTGDAHQFRAGRANKVFESLLGPNSLLLLDESRHRRERKLLMPPFHGARMRLYGEMMWEIVDRSIDTWPVGAAFPIHPCLTDTTLEVILRIVFGVDEGSRLARLRALVSDALRIFDRGNPLWGIAVWWRFVRIRSEIRELLLEEVRRRRARPSNERTDVMSLLVAARDEDGQCMTVEEIRDEMITLLVGGHESTAASLAWVIHRLLEHPDVLAAAQAEAVSVIGNGPHMPAPTAEQVASLVYLDAVIKETARLNPIVPVVARQLTTDLRVGDSSLPSGCIAAPCIYLVHRRPTCGTSPRCSTRPGSWVDVPIRMRSSVRWRGSPLYRCGVCHVRDEDRIGSHIVARGPATASRPLGSSSAARLLLCPSRNLRVIVH